MQLRPQELNNIYKSGVFISLLVVLFIVFVFTLSKEDSVFESKLHLHIMVKNAQNLKKGAAVHLKGLRIGTVKDIEFKNINDIKINFIVKKDYQNLVKEDSYVAFKTQGVLGDTYLEILGGTENSSNIKDGGLLGSGEGKGMGAFISKSQSVLETAHSVVVRIDNMLEEIQSQSKISQTLNNLNIMTEGMAYLFKKNLLQSTMSNINESTRNLAHMTQNMSKVTKQISDGPGTIHSLIYDDTAYEDLTTLLGGAHRSNVIKYFIRESIKKSEKLNQ